MGVRKLLAAPVLLLAAGLPQTASPQSIPPSQQAARVQAAKQLVKIGTQIQKTTLDCSHFVNSLFEAIGLRYAYQPSHVLYHGAEAFKRIYRPSAGDLIVWPGHVGIVVDPDERTFVSALRTGVKVASYTSPYWRQRGHPRFLRYNLPVVSPAMASEGEDEGQSVNEPGMSP